jgi:hypothetical protein
MGQNISPPRESLKISTFKNKLQIIIKICVSDIKIIIYNDTSSYIYQIIIIIIIIIIIVKNVPVLN